MKIGLIIISIIVLAGCQQSNPYLAPPQKEFNFWDAVSAKTSDWSYSCYEGGTDQFGENRKIPYCIITVSNLGKSIIGNSYTISYANIINYTKLGTKILKPQPDSPCDGIPKRIAVDGKRIDQLSDALQVKAMLTGKIYTREEQAEWPYCGIAAHAAYLNGFSEVYAKMMNEYKIKFSN